MLFFYIFVVSFTLDFRDVTTTILKLQTIFFKKNTVLLVGLGPETASTGVPYLNDYTLLVLLTPYEGVLPNTIFLLLSNTWQPGTLNIFLFDCCIIFAFNECKVRRRKRIWKPKVKGLPHHIFLCDYFCFLRLTQISSFTDFFIS